MVTPGKTALERAFELALSDRCGSLAHVRCALRDEGYDTNQLQGTALVRQLNSLIAKNIGRARKDKRSPL